jgi:hypothetical protein
MLYDHPTIEMIIPLMCKGAQRMITTSDLVADMCIVDDLRSMLTVSLANDEFGRLFRRVYESDSITDVVLGLFLAHEHMSDALRSEAVHSLPRCKLPAYLYIYGYVISFLYDLG